MKTIIFVCFYLDTTFDFNNVLLNVEITLIDFNWFMLLMLTNVSKLNLIVNCYQIFFILSFISFLM